MHVYKDSICQADFFLKLILPVRLSYKSYFLCQPEIFFSHNKKAQVYYTFIILSSHLVYCILIFLPSIIVSMTSYNYITSTLVLQLNRAARMHGSGRRADAAWELVALHHPAAVATKLPLRKPLTQHWEKMKNNGGRSKLFFV